MYPARQSDRFSKRKFLPPGCAKPIAECTICRRWTWAYQSDPSAAEGLGGLAPDPDPDKIAANCEARTRRRDATQFRQGRAPGRGPAPLPGGVHSQWSCTPASTTTTTCPRCSSSTSEMPPPDHFLAGGGRLREPPGSPTSSPGSTGSCNRKNRISSSSSETSPAPWPAPWPPRSATSRLPTSRPACAAGTGACRRRSTAWLPTPPRTCCSPTPRTPTPTCSPRTCRPAAFTGSAT